MKPTEEKIQELVRAIHIISYEGYYYTQDEGEGETNAIFRTIIHLASKALGREENKPTRWVGED